MEDDIQTAEIRISVFRANPEHHLNVDDFGGPLEVGLLVDKLTQEPLRLADRGVDGKIEVKIERAHEFEFIITIVLIGAKAFVGGAMTALGKYSVDWIISRAKKVKTKQNPEVRGVGLGTVAIDPLMEAEQTAPAVTALFEEAVQKKVPAQIVIDPGFDWRV